MTAGQNSCPPHHWEVTSREENRIVYDHHRCRHCGLEKDTVRAPLSTQGGWGARKGERIVRPSAKAG
jgi:hypothetical protein